MKKHKLVLSVLVVCLPVLSVRAGQWTYNSGSATLSHDTSGWILAASRNGTNLTVTGVSQSPGTPSALPLSDPMPGYVLVSIGSSAFSGCTRLTSVTIPASVTSIGNYAFFSCSALTSITIPVGVTSIGDYAFTYCSALASVTIPASVASIGEGAFGSCASLTTIKVSENNPNYASFNDVLFNKNLTTLIQCPGAFSGHFNIPDNVTSIVEQAFARCSYLTSVTIPNGVTNIGESAFSECIGLTGVVIPDSVISVGDDAFFGCTVWDVEWNPIGGLSSVVIGNGVKNIGVGAFLGCAALTNLVIGCSVTDIGESAFGECVSLTSIMIPDSVTSIGDCAFGDCYALTNAVIGDGVTNIGYGAFQYCTGLTGVEIPDSVTSIGDWAFEGCESLASVTIRCGESAFAYDTFYGCENIRRLTLDMPEISSQWAWNAYGINRDNVETLVIGNNVTSIYYNAFAGMTGLTSVVIGSGVTDIGDYAFQRCTSLSRVTILCDGAAFLYEYEHSWTNSNGVTNYVHGFSMKQYVFDGCVNIRELVLDMPTVPQNFDSAFFKQGWYNYETGEFEIEPYGPAVSTNGVSVIFGDSVTNIEAYAFSNTVGPTNIVFGSGTVIINSGFSDCVGLTSVAFGSGMVNVNGYDGFDNCDALTDIAFGSGTVIINGGFQNCDGLTNLVFGSGAVSINNSGFDNCDGLVNIVFGSGTVNINGGFYDCDGLTDLIFGDGAVAIGDGAFYGCDGLTDIVFGAGLTDIGSGAFSYCAGLTNLSVAAENPVCRDIGGVLYSKDGATLLTFPAGRGGEYAVPDGTACIGQYAFAGCDGLTGLWLPASVANAGESVWVFYWVRNGQVFSINTSSALCVGVSLTNISVSAENPVYRDIGGVLYGKDGATLLSYPAGRAGGYAVPPGVLRISAGAFAGRAALTDVTIPGSVTSIESRAFFNCGGLTNIVFGSGTVNVEAMAFCGCGVTSVTGTTVAEIARGAGVTSAMVHYYFQTKEQLLEAVVQDKLVDGFLAYLGGAMEAGTEPEELVAGLVWRIVEASDRMPWLPSLWVREVISEGGALRDQVIRRADLGMTERFKAQIAAAQKRGSVNPGVNPQLLLMSIIALTMLPLSMAKSWSRLPLIGPVSKQDLGRHVVALLTRGLAAGPQAKAKGRRKA